MFETICIVTDDLLSNRLEGLICQFIGMFKKIRVAYPKYKASKAQSMAITVDNHVSFTVDNTNVIDGTSIKYYGYEAKPADAFLFFYTKYKDAVFIFGPNDTTHSGCGILTSSTVSLLNFAKFFKVKAASISCKEYTKNYKRPVEIMMERIDKGHFSYNFFDDGYPVLAEPAIEFPDVFEPIKLYGRESKGLYWLSYKPILDGGLKDSYYENHRINYCVEI